MTGPVAPDPAAGSVGSAQDEEGLSGYQAFRLILLASLMAFGVIDTALGYWQGWVALGYAPIYAVIAFRPEWFVQLGYWVRPFDMIADRRRWRWQRPAPCGRRTWADASPEAKAALQQAIDDFYRDEGR
jgi:hypothetical protein